MLIRILILCLFSFVSCVNCFPQSKSTTDIDSTTLSYYDKCLDHRADPVVLSMVDTLLQMAQRNNDQRMVAVSMCTKLDYYYSNHSETSKDSVYAWVERVKAFAKKTNQPKYYYFVWGGRLIPYHIGQGEYNIALIETEKMLKEAEAEDYKEGIAECYTCLSSIYAAKELEDKALEFVIKEIELSEKYNLERYNISLRYFDAARIYIDRNELEPVPSLLERGILQQKTLYQTFTGKFTTLLFHLAKDEMEEAAALLRECKEDYQNEASLSRAARYFNATLVKYYSKTEEYDKLFQTIEEWKESVLIKNETVTLNKITKIEADIYWKLNKPAEAAGLYRKYIDNLERSKNEEISTGEFATILNMQKLTAEKNELQQLAQQKQLENTRIIIISLSILLCIVCIFLYLQRRLNKRLKKSRDKLNEKNLILQITEEQLRKAKNLAEKSSSMKTSFIQNMSHEIRTPLNSIVGFSAVLADAFSESNEEVSQFALLIEENSQLLLRLISDILTVSTLEEVEKHEIEYSTVEINPCCQQVIKEMKSKLNENVQLRFTPTCDDLTINSCEEYLINALKHLLGNAMKFTREGEIELTYQLNKEEGEIAFIVTDTGSGIPPDQQELIFERFVKLDEFSQGTGLGLPICKLIAQKLEGNLILDTTYTNGCRFVLTIPA